MHDLSEAIKKSKDNLLEHNTRATNVPNSRPKKFEALVLSTLVKEYLSLDFSPESDSLNLSQTNQMPYRRVTQGAEINQSVEVKTLVNWASPVFEVSKEEYTLSFFREGTPVKRGRFRPDILVYPAGFQIEKKSHPLFGEGIKVSWHGEKSGSYRYATVTNQKGPVRRDKDGELVTPKLGLEVSLNKSCERLRKQISILDELGSKSIEVILSHENPCCEMESEANIQEVKNYNSLKKVISDIVH